MEEKLIDIAQILNEQNVREGTKFYCTIYGDVYFKEVFCVKERPLTITISLPNLRGDIELDIYGRKSENGECVLYPSKEQRDWTKYKYAPDIVLHKIISDYYYHKQHLLSQYFFDLTPKLQCIIKMMAAADYLNDGWEPDWNDRLQYKYCIEMTLYESEWRFSVFFVTDRRFNACYFKTAELAEKAIEILGESCLRVALS